MNLYEPKHLADSMRVVRKNTIAIAEDIPDAQYHYRPTQDSRSVRETFLHMASMTLFDLHIHEEQKRTSMEGFDFRGFFAGLPTNEKCSLPKSEVVAVAARRRGTLVRLGREAPRSAGGRVRNTRRGRSRGQKPLRDADRQQGA